jgi:manganese/zinc/iron transport system substrate-binding protein
MRENQKLKVLATTSQVGDLVSSIGGERIDLWVLMQGDLDPHSYELVKGDGEKFDRADQIFFSGLGLEHGASVSQQLKNRTNSLGISDAIYRQYPDQILFKEGAFDPHLWMDISLWQKGVDPIVQALSAKDPEGSSYYRQRGELLKEEMEKTHERLKKDLAEVPSQKRYLVTSHDAFHYFARAYLAEANEINWQSRVAAPEGLAPDGQLNPADIQQILDFLSEHQISVIFPETNVSRDSLQKIRSAGKKLKIEVKICSEPLYGDTMGNLKYLAMMQRNVEVIKCNLLSNPTN